MGVKIEIAIYSETGKPMSNLKANEQELNGKNFTCPYCSKGLIFRKSGKRKLENRTIDISPYFYLEKGIEHGPGCRYNTFGQIEIIARQPLALTDFMEKKKENQMAIRLQVVKKAMAEPPEDGEGGTADPKGKGDAQNKKYKNSGSMAPYLSRMKDIMVLRSRMEENKDIKKYLKLEYGKKTISWDKFYFGPEYKGFLELSKYFRNKQAPKHPVCVEGIIKEYKKVQKKRGGYFYSFLLEKPFIEDTDTEGYHHIPSVSLNIDAEHERLVNYMKDNYQKHVKQVVAYGDPYAEVKPSEAQKIKYHNISIWINRTAQVHLFNDVFTQLLGE
ncbi:hypothetical protein [Peribacillus aracenensis]|uniref:hypothetical protein n=1 Tax=Peribacillus aracenensis TaxID=2976708 RepID=UPI0021A3C348|nr:hypothetical protein [Peribacillus sp. BBB004]